MGTQHRPRPIVAGEYDQGVFINPGFFDCLHHLPHWPINLLNCIAISPPLALTLEGIRGKHRCMRHVMGQIKEKRFVLISRNPLNRFLRVAFGKKLLISRHINQFTSSNKWHLKGELIALIKNTSSLPLPWWCGHIVTTRCSKMVIKPAF